jgi:hypothetical protein
MLIAFWGILAIGSGSVMLWIVARRARPADAPLPADAGLPATPLQRIARWSIALGALLAMAATGLVMVKGPEVTFESDPLRMVFTLLLLALLGLVGGTSAWLKRQIRRDGGALDERDEEILGRAPAMQAAGMLVTLAIWTVGIAERFHDAGAVPLFYLYLVFWSCVVVYLLGLPVGVLAGYRSS